MTWPSLRAGRDRSYGVWAAAVQPALVAVLMLGAICGPVATAVAEPRTLRIVALGDSLVAGLGLPAEAAFPARLASALQGKGILVNIIDAGVSGDTAANGLARLDWAVPEGTDGVIVALGANDMLRGQDPAQTRKALDGILRRLRERRIPVLLAGMRAAPNFGEAFGKAFEQVYADLAANYDVVFYPFLLDGVAGVPRLNQRDGIHPNAEGVDRMVAGILPKAEELVSRIARTPQP